MNKIIHTHKGKTRIALEIITKPLHLNLNFEFANLRSRSRSFPIYNNVPLCVHVRAFGELYYTNVSMFWRTQFFSLFLLYFCLIFFSALVVIFSRVDLNCFVQSGEAFQSNSRQSFNLYYFVLWWCTLCAIVLCVHSHSHVTYPIH